MSFQNCPYKGGSPPIEEKNHTNTTKVIYSDQPVDFLLSPQATHYLKNIFSKIM